MEIYFSENCHSCIIYCCAAIFVLQMYIIIYFDLFAELDEYFNPIL
jgi:hypothetical protein